MLDKTGILRSSAGRYSHFQEALAWSSDHRSLHLSCRLHADRGASETIAYMRSDDFGQTWHRRDGSVRELPATNATMDVIATGGRSKKLLSHKSCQWPGWQIGPAPGMAFDEQRTMFVTVTLSREKESDIVLLVSSDGGDSFSMKHLSNHLPRDRKWWPSLERPTGHNVIAEHPGVYFFHCG